MTSFSAEVRELMVWRARLYGRSVIPKCEVMAQCGGAPATQAHHRRARGMGGSSRDGTNLASNGLMVCDADHREIESLRTLARMSGWLISNFDKRSPADIPCLYKGRWMLLGDDGRASPWIPREGEVQRYTHHTGLNAAGVVCCVTPVPEGAPCPHGPGLCKECSSEDDCPCSPPIMFDPHCPTHGLGPR